MICRDRDTDTETSGLETREYVLQNWRADVVALAATDGDLLERVSYDPYGIPFGTHPTDLTTGATSGVAGYGMPDGSLGGNDYSYYLILYTASNWRADWDRDGDIDAADNTAYTNDKNAASGSWGRGVLSNRENILGYAGYVHEPATGAAGGGHGTMWHVRHRVMHSGLGRWVQRDPSGYRGGASLVQAVDSSPIGKSDWTGLVASSETSLAPCSTIAGDSGGGCGPASDPAPGHISVCCRRIWKSPGGPVPPIPTPFVHCEIEYGGCTKNREFQHPTTPNRSSGRRMAGNGCPCSEVSAEQIICCLNNIYPYDVREDIPGTQTNGAIPTANCQTNTANRLRACCLDADWETGVIADPVGYPARNWVPGFVENCVRNLPRLVF